MAKEYIDREAALTEFAKVCDICMALMARPTCGECSVADTVRKIKRIPAADVVEVKRGKWIVDRLVSTSGGTYGVRRCSLCESYYQDVGYGYYYCPNCGAKMDKEGDGRK